MGEGAELREKVEGANKKKGKATREKERGGGQNEGEDKKRGKS